MIESDEDRLEYLKAMGELVDIDGLSLFGVFENEFATEGDFPGVASSEPTITCRSSDVRLFHVGDEVVRESGDKFTIREIEPDGTGMTLLRLNTYG